MPEPREIEDRYGFAVHSLIPLPDSDRAWLVESDHGPLVLRLHGPERAQSQAGEVSVLRFLEEAGYPAPRLLTAQDGQAITRWDEKTGYVTTFVLGEPPKPGIESPRKLGQATGRLHALNTEGARLPETHFTIAAEKENFSQLDADSAVRAWKGYAEIRDQLVPAWESLPDLGDMPQTLLHTDVLFENSIQTPAGDIVLIDWDDVGIGPAIQDIGYFLAESALPPDGGEHRIEIIRAFLDGYQAAWPLSLEERDRLPDAILFGALVYVLLPWESKISETIWRRARYFLDHRDQITAQIASIPLGSA